MTAKARIAVIGAGLMGHGIAQVFALAGHDVTIYDPVDGEPRQRQGAHRRRTCAISATTPAAVERVHAACRSRRRGARRRLSWSRRCSEDLPLKQKLFAEIERHVRPRHDPRQQHLGDPDHRDHARPAATATRALGTHWWNPPYLVPLVEVIGTQWTSPQAIERTMALHARRRQDAGACEEGRAGLHRQPPAACAVARGDRAGRARHLRRRDRRHGDQGELRPPARGARAARECRSRRHRSDARDPQDRAAGTSRAAPGPSPYLEKLVADGKLGFKSGEGFRTWTPSEQAALRAKRAATSEEGTRARTERPSMRED